MLNRAAIPFYPTCRIGRASVSTCSLHMGGTGCWWRRLRRRALARGLRGAGLRPARFQAASGGSRRGRRRTRCAAAGPPPVAAVGGPRRRGRRAAAGPALAAESGQRAGVPGAGRPRCGLSDSAAWAYADRAWTGRVHPKGLDNTPSEEVTCLARRVQREISVRFWLSGGVRRIRRAGAVGEQQIRQIEALIKGDS